ncbi:MAG: tetratricopeptide repeat protein [Aurantibacter sp.]
MNKALKIFLFLMLSGLYLIPFLAHAQEETPEIGIEESAEVFLEDYSDDFQENFFEALKQKGIENYDKAINLLLECKQLQPSNIVVDHELAKAYLADEQYISAQEYAIIAVNTEPANLWYLDTLVEIVHKQGNSIDGLTTQIPYSNTQFQENLALIYFKQKRYEKALEVLEPVGDSSFSEDLESKIKDSIKKEEANSQKVEFTVVNSGGTDPTQAYKSQIDGLIRINGIQQLLTVSEEALDNYPSQPYFYYAHGYALNKRGKHRDAIEILESGIDYLLNDISLANKIYTQLADAYTALNNSVKANMYLSKVKPGF